MVGFDLDMTLIDTVSGFAATLEALGRRARRRAPGRGADRTARPTARPAARAPPARRAVGPAADRFREIYPDIAVAPTPALAGVAEALAAVRRHGGRIVLVTGKHTPNAQLHVDHLGLDVDVVEGGSGAPARARCCAATVRTSTSATTSTTSRARRRPGSPASRCSPAAAPARSSRRPAPTSSSTDLTGFPAWLDGYVLGGGWPRWRQPCAPTSA